MLLFLHISHSCNLLDLGPPWRQNASMFLVHRVLLVPARRKTRRRLVRGFRRLDWTLGSMMPRPTESARETQTLNHLSLRERVRSAIHASRKHTSPIVSYLLKLPPPPGGTTRNGSFYPVRVDTGTTNLRAVQAYIFHAPVAF